MIPAKEPPKAFTLYNLALEEYKQLHSIDVRIRRGLLVEKVTPESAWTVCNKQQLLYSLYVAYGMDFKFSEIERELFPAILAMFDQSEDGRIHE